MHFPKNVMITEVGPRDGLQNEATLIPTDIKIEWINKLSACGFKSIEVTSFVSKHAIPALEDHTAVFEKINKKAGVDYLALVPNFHGFLDSQKAGVKYIALFTAASETFNQKNIHCSIEESFARFYPIAEAAKRLNIKMRGYISCALGCPYEGDISPMRVAQIAKRLFDLGCANISLGDTIGVGTPFKATQLINNVAAVIPLSTIACHFHDTYGQALANCYAALSMGVAHFDSSTGGLGGCPYANGASGNIATEDLVYMLNGLEIKTDIDLPRLIETSLFMTHFLNIQPRSKVTLASWSKNRSQP